MNGRAAVSGLVEYGRVLRSRWRWIVWGVLLALAATTVFLILFPPLYRSEARVFVRTPGDVSRVLDGGDSYAQGRARTYAALANSSSVAARVIVDLGLDLEPQVLSARIHATNPPGTALIDVTVSAPSAAEAQRTATVFLAEYAATVRTLESVPGSLVPRAELVVVDPPGRPVQVFALGTPISVVLSGAVLTGALLGALAAVLQSVFARSAGVPHDTLGNTVGAERDSSEPVTADDLDAISLSAGNGEPSHGETEGDRRCR